MRDASIVARLRGQVLGLIETHRDPILRSVKVGTSTRAGQRHTWVKVRHTTRGHGGALVLATTERQSLRAKHFGNAAMQINRATARGHGAAPVGNDRGLYYLDLRSGEPIAALAFHIPSEARGPLVVRAVAIRVDRPELLDHSRLACVLLTAHLQAASFKLKRNTDLLAYPAPAEEARFWEALFTRARGPHYGGRPPWAQRRFRIFDR